MAVSIGSLASGLPPDIVDQLVEVERKPIYNLERNKKELENKKKLLNELKSRINQVPVKNVKDIYGFREVKAQSSDPEVLLAKADKRVAESGTHSIEVKQLAGKSSALSVGFPDKDKSQIGIGYLSYTNTDGEDVEIYIGPGNNTLEGVASVINKNPDFGFKANVINDGKDPDKPYKLLLNGSDTGASGAVKWNTSYFLDGDYDFYMENDKKSQDAIIELDGFEIKVPDNNVKNILPGISVDLLKAEEGKKITISVAEDINVVTDKIKKIVDSVNRVLEFIQSQNQLTSNSNTRQTLGGDITLTTVESKIRRLFSSPITGASPNLRYLSEVGIGFQRNGSLAMDENKFSKMINDRFEDVSTLFIGKGDGKTGLIPLLNREFNDFTKSNSGIISSRESGLIRQIDNIDSDINRKKINVEKKREQLKKRFASLESSMSALKSQSSYVQSALGGQGSNLNLSAAKVS